MIEGAPQPDKRHSSCHHNDAVRPIHGVLFDLDGTLADTAPDLISALNHSLTEFGYPACDPDTMRSAASHGSLALIKAAQPDLAPEQAQATQQRLLHHYQQLNGQQTTLFTGLASVLSLLDDKGIPYGVVTNKAARFARPLLDRLTLSQRMRTIISGDSTHRSKPHPAPLYLAAQQMACSPENIVYLGDAERDLIAAKNANMQGGVALWGYIGKTCQPHTWPADHYFAKTSCLKHWLSANLGID